MLLVDEQQDALLDWLRNDDGRVFKIACSKFNQDEPDRYLHFHGKHVSDLRAIRAINREFFQKNDT